MITVLGKLDILFFKLTCFNFRNWTVVKKNVEDLVRLVRNLTRVRKINVGEAKSKILSIRFII